MPFSKSPNFNKELFDIIICLYLFDWTTFLILGQKFIKLLRWFFGKLKAPKSRSELTFKWFVKESLEEYIEIRCLSKLKSKHLLPKGQLNCTRILKVGHKAKAIQFLCTYNCPNSYFFQLFENALLKNYCYLSISRSFVYHLAVTNLELT